MTKFKKGDKVKLVKKAFFFNGSGKQEKNYVLGTEFIVDSIDGVKDIRMISHEWINEECLELVTPESKGYRLDHMFISDPLSMDWNKIYVTDDTLFTETELYKLPKLKQTTMQKLKSNIKRMLSKNHQTLYKVGFLNGNLEYTEEAKKSLITFLLEKHEVDLVKIAEEQINEIEAEEKK